MTEEQKSGKRTIGICPRIGKQFSAECTLSAGLSLTIRLDRTSFFCESVDLRVSLSLLPSFRFRLEPLHVCSPTPKIPLSSFSGPKFLDILVLSPNSPLFQWNCFSLLTSVLSFTLLGCLESRSRDALERYLLLSSLLCRSAFCPLNSLLYFSKKKKHSSLLLLWN